MSPNFDTKMEQNQQIKEIEEKILAKHPNWPQDKARWLAMRAMGMG